MYCKAWLVLTFLPSEIFISCSSFLFLAEIQKCSCWTEVNRIYLYWYQSMSTETILPFLTGTWNFLTFYTIQHCLLSFLYLLFSFFFFPCSSARANELAYDRLDQKALPLALAAEPWHWRLMSSIQICKASVQRNHLDSLAVLSIQILPDTGLTCWYLLT